MNSPDISHSGGIMFRFRLFSVAFSLVIVFSLTLPVTGEDIISTSVVDNAPGFNIGRVDLGYDNGIPGPRRDDPGPDWIEYDDQSPRTLSTAQNLWSRVIFTPNADFELWGVRVMPLNQRGNNSPCRVKVYSEDQDNHDLDDLLWEGTIEQLRRYNGNPNNDWHWIELDEDDRVVIEAGDDFSIMYGPAPGGDYNGAQEGDGWWNVWDGATDVERSYTATGNQPPTAHNQWRVIQTGDLMIRANGEYQGDFVDLGVTAVYNAEEESERRWMTFLVNEMNLFADIVNEGAEVEEFTVTFEVVNPDGDVVFEREIEVDGIDEEESITIECDEAWEVPMEIGHYTVWVTVAAEDDANDDNNILGMEQIVFDQEESRDTWIGYVGGEIGNPTSWSVGNGWAVRIDHPGGNIPLWITALRAGISGAVDIECPFSVHIIDLDAEPDENGGYDLGDPEWRGTGNVQQGQQWVTVELDEDDYVTIHEGEGLVVTYYFVNGGNFLNDAAPPIAGVSAMMPLAMMQSVANSEIYTNANAGDYAIQIHMSGPDHGGVLNGNVYEAGDESPIEGALVVTSQDHRDVTNEDGRFEFPFGPHGDFELTVSKHGYNTMILDDLHLEDDEELELEIFLLHPGCVPSEVGFSDHLEPGMRLEIDFTVHNNGNGPLEYSIERRLVGEADVDPWDLRGTLNAEAIVEDSYLNGVVFVNDHFYLTGGNNGQQANNIYVLNRDGEEVGEFDQFQESRQGMRDLTWDGELIWGADVTGDVNILYGFDTDCELVRTIQGEARFYRSLAWDPDERVFWSSDITSDIYATDVHGNLVREIERPADMLIYGLAYWPDDPDGYNLYVLSRGDELDIKVTKFDLENGLAMDVTEFDFNDGRPAGIYITNEFDVMSWVMIGLIQNPDNVGVWQLAGRREWFQIDPEAGTIEADQRPEFILILDATGLPLDVTFRGLLDFHHNAAEEVILPVELEIIEGEVHTTRTLHLHTGWNMVSVSLQPDEEDMEVLMAGLVEEGLLEMMKDDAGHFFLPWHNFNNIPGWYVDQGYQMKMRGAADLTLEGMSVVRDHPIELEAGWQIIPYYPSIRVDATLALSGIEAQLIIAKDGYGNFYIPDWEFCNIGDMRPGQGYYVNVEENVVLVYVWQQNAALGEAGLRQLSVYDSPGCLPVHAVTGENMSVLVLADGNPPLRSRGVNNSNPPLRSRGGIKGGVEVGIYTSGKLVGSGVLQDNVCGISVWGDDPSTTEVDGAVEGQELEIRLLDNNGLHRVDFRVLSGEAVYGTDGLLVIELDAAAALPEEFTITSAYPNPFNSRMQVGYSLPEPALVKLSLYDVSGRFVAELLNGRRQAGFHAAVFDGSDLASGIYLIRFEAAGYVSHIKVAMVK